MPINDHKTALVTGASSGIGAACAEALSAAGIHVIATARRRDRLDELAAATGCETVVLDLKDTRAVYDTLSGREIDILINNAGLGRGMEAFLSSSIEDIDEVIDVNIAAAFHVARAVVPDMVKRSRGHIVHISSLSALYPVGIPVYAASKGAFHLFSQNLRMEIRNSGVRLTEICPGRVSTEFFDGAFKSDQEREDFMANMKPLRPTDVAGSVMYAIGTPPSVNINLIELTPVNQVPGFYVKE